MVEDAVAAAREHFREVVAGPAERLDLCEAALWIAAESCVPLDVEAQLQKIDALAEDAAEAARGANPKERAEGLVAYLHGDQGFRGNAQDYYDPRNSYLNEVLDRRLGIPISLSILWVGIANRLELPAAGVAFPGHFLATTLEDAVVVDPFHGRVVGPDECEELLRRSGGPGARFDERMLAPAPAARVLARVLSNLKQIHVRNQDWEQALGCSERILMLLPDEALELRDRGLLYRALDCFRPALDDLETFVALAPESEEAKALHPVLAELRGRATTLN